MTLQLQVMQLFAQPSLIFKPFLIQEVIFESTDESSFFNLNNIIIIVLGISIIANIIFMIMVKNRNRDLNKLQDKDDYKRFKKLYEKEQVETSKLNRELRSVHSHYSTAEIKSNPNVQRNKFDKKFEVSFNEQNESSREPTIGINDESPTTIDWGIKKQEVLFLPSPFEDKRFTIEDVSKEKTSSSLYKIVLNSNGSAGELILLEDADFTRALNSPDLYLEKACTYENAFNPQAKRIDVVKTGSVKLENQDWFVTEKIKIKFI